MNGNLASKLDTVRQYLLQDMMKGNVSTQIQLELNNVMNLLVLKANAGTLFDSRGNITIQIQNPNLRNLVNKMVADLKADKAENVMNKVQLAAGKKVGLVRGYNWWYSPSWYNYWWYGYNPYWTGYYYYWQPYYYWYPYYSGISYVGKKAGKRLGLAMSPHIEPDYDSNPVNNIEYTTDEFLEYVDDLEKEVQNATIRCDKNGQCNMSMNFISLRPERGINGSLDCTSGNCDLGIKFVSARR